MKLVFLILASSVCFADQYAPDAERANYWKLRSEIAEANAVFSGSLSAEQKRMLETIRSKSMQLQSLRNSMLKSCASPTVDQSGEPVCSTETPKAK